MGAHCPGSRPGPDPLWHSRDCRARYTLAKPRSYVVEKHQPAHLSRRAASNCSGAVAPPGPRLCKKLTLTHLVGVSITFLQTSLLDFVHFLQGRRMSASKSGGISSIHVKTVRLVSMERSRSKRLGKYPVLCQGTSPPL